MRVDCTAHRRVEGPRFGVRPVASGCVALLLVPALLFEIAAAQQVAPPTQPDPAVPPPAVAVQPKSEPRGLFEAIGRWFDEGTAGFRSHVSGARTSMDEFNQRAEETRRSLGETAVEMSKNAVGAGATAADAVGAVARLPLSRVVQGRERCLTAPNGAPDCLAAAETLCRKQGFSTGKSVDFTSAESCPVKAWIGGKQGEPTECTTVTFISRAMCQ